MENAMDRDTDMDMDFAKELWSDFEHGDIDAIDDLLPFEIEMVLQHPINRLNQINQTETRDAVAV